MILEKITPLAISGSQSVLFDVPIEGAVQSLLQLKNVGANPITYCGILVKPTPNAAWVAMLFGGNAITPPTGMDLAVINGRTLLYTSAVIGAGWGVHDLVATRDGQILMYTGPCFGLRVLVASTLGTSVKGFINCL